MATDGGYDSNAVRRMTPGERGWLLARIDKWQKDAKTLVNNPPRSKIA